MRFLLCLTLLAPRLFAQQVRPISWSATIAHPTAVPVYAQWTQPMLAPAVVALAPAAVSVPAAPAPLPEPATERETRMRALIDGAALEFHAKLDDGPLVGGFDFGRVTHAYAAVDERTRRRRALRRRDLLDESSNLNDPMAGLKGEGAHAAPHADFESFVTQSFLGDPSVVLSVLVVGALAASVVRTHPLWEDGRLSFLVYSAWREALEALRRHS